MQNFTDRPLMLLSKKYKANIHNNWDRTRAMDNRIASDFQWKYTLFLIASVVGSFGLFLGVSVWNQLSNYEIFKKLAFETNPELLQHLEREMAWLIMFTVVSILAIGVFTFILGMKMTANMTRPLYHLEKHMKKIIRGDWSSPDFQYNKNDDFMDFLSTYSYMYRTLRALTEAEIQMLEKLVIDPNNREAMLIWKQLLNTKRQQLQLKTQTKTNDVSTAEAPEIRHAS